MHEIIEAEGGNYTISVSKDARMQNTKERK
jgi:hypothetical protein